MTPDFGYPTPTTGPAYQPAEFRELKAPAIPVPRRNYTPREGFITMNSVPRRGATTTPPVDLSPRDLERGRESSHSRATARGSDPASPMQRIIRCLRQSDEPMSSKEIAAVSGIGVAVNGISSYIAKYRRDNPSHVAVIKRHGTNQRLYRWIGTEEGAA